MRESFHGDLNRLGEQLMHMCELAGAAMRDATRALLTADLSLAEQALAGDAALDTDRADCETHAQSLLALQAPVARDLRTILAAIYCAEKIERMGDLAAHIADTARFVHPKHAVPAELEPSFTEMSEVAATMAERLAQRIASDAAGGFAELNETDHTLDVLHARVLHRVTSEQWEYGVQSATSLALLARFYERFGDQAVSVAKRLEFVETGEIPPRTSA